MIGYRNILVAIDLSDESAAIIERAQGAAAADAALHLVHVQESMDTVYLGVVPFGPVFPGADDLDERLREELSQRLRAWGERCGIGAARSHLLTGTPAREIHAFAEERGCDLIVIGTHGQKGVQLLLGATANSVLHGACCDVLAVRVRKDD